MKGRLILQGEVLHQFRDGPIVVVATLGAVLTAGADVTGGESSCRFRMIATSRSLLCACVCYPAQAHADGRFFLFPHAGPAEQQGLFLNGHGVELCARGERWR